MQIKKKQIQSNEEMQEKKQTQEKEMQSEQQMQEKNQMQKEKQMQSRADEAMPHGDDQQDDFWDLQCGVRESHGPVYLFCVFTMISLAICCSNSDRFANWSIHSLIMTNSSSSRSTC